MRLYFHLRIVLITFILLVSIQNNFSQGCSDAGFCTMGAMKPDQSFVKRGNTKFRTIEMSQYLGLTRFKDYINVTNLDINLLIFKNYNLQLKSAYFIINGPLGSNNGLGDISTSVSRPIFSKEKFVINATLGAKIPTNRSDAKNGNASLPMYYQTSLGTFDFVAGLSLNLKGWLFATGYQQVVVDINENKFRWGPFRELGLFETSQRYAPSMDLIRGKDVMFRVEKNFNYSKFNFYFGLLDVYRLNEDIAVNPNTLLKEKVEDQEGTSKGHAITFLSGVGFNFDVKSSVKLLFGQRLIKRHFNTDGLSREKVFSLSYQYKF